MIDFKEVLKDACREFHFKSEHRFVNDTKDSSGNMFQLRDELKGCILHPFAGSDQEWEIEKKKHSKELIH